MPNEKPAILDANTRISFGFLKEAQTYLLAGCVWLIVTTESIKHRLDNIEERLPQAWTKNNQLLFESEFRGRNPGINVPDSSKQ